MVKPPHSPLCNSEILAAIESASSDLRSFSDLTTEGDVPMYLGMADVDNCFDRIRISESLGQFFVWPGDFSTRELGLVGTIYKGSVLTAASRVRLCCASLPMGFGWSLYFAQKINQERMQESTALAQSTLINDSSGTVIFEQSSPNISISCM